MAKKNKLIIFALGGNEISPVEIDPRTGKLITPDLPTQWKRTAKTCEIIADFIKDNQESHYVVTHGNGPQIGNILLRSEYSSKYLHKIPLDVCGADSQGALGYMLAQLSNSLQMRGLDIHTAEIITQVIVDSRDPAFENPEKFIGPPLTKDEASGLMKESPDYRAKFYKLAEDGEDIWRRVVPSPIPTGIVEIDIIEACFLSGNIPIAVGGGGIPVVKVTPRIESGSEPHKEFYDCNYGICYERENTDHENTVSIFKGVEGVIDKDLASSLLAGLIMERAQKRGHDLEVELVILTNVDSVKLNFQQPNEKSFSALSLKEATELYESGAFPAGSMGPKIKAMLDFLSNGGKKSYITKVDLLRQTFAGEAGTTFTA
ncbi:MAG: carbamate kinase [SAR324 cluster bacterium]|nr:carbamate kinase [SAR324 cluster bacterium]MBL7034246.1 carbamate kinase [SAR324 cluster bacterium]